MKRFVWRLQHVLDIKAKQEQAKRAELFELTKRLAQTQGRLLARQRIVNNITSSIVGRKPEKRLVEQEFFLKYSAASAEHIGKLSNQIRQLESQQRRKIAEVAKVRKLKEGLEKLRAKAKKRFIKEQERLEQKELDEGATVSFTRKKHPVL